jgi:hypothetical protein
MIKIIQILSNGSARLIDEEGYTESIDLLKPLIDKLKKEGKINEKTVINSTLGFDVKISEWYNISE